MPAVQQMPRAQPDRSKRRQLNAFRSARLTLRGGRDHNTAVPVPRITKEDLKQRLDSGAPPVLVDARLKYPYEHSTVRLPGAIRFTAPTVRRRRCRAIATSSCTTPIRTSWRARDVAAELIRQGYRAVALKGGIVDWLAANLPTETKEAPKQAPPEPGALKG